MNRMALAVAVAVAAAMAGTAFAGGGCGAAGACASSAPAAQKPAAPSYGKIDTQGLKSLVDSKAPVVVVDARSAQWDDGKRIPGAIMLTSDSSDEAIAAALPSKDALVVTYCSNLKCPASAKLAEKLVGLGYKNVVKYPEGLAGWVEAGHEVTETEKPAS